MIAALCLIAGREPTWRANNSVSAAGGMPMAKDDPRPIAIREEVAQKRRWPDTLAEIAAARAP